MTQCSETLFQFEAHFSRQVVAEFSGAPLTTEGGSLLLRQADRKIGLLRRAAACFTDCRQQERIWKKCWRSAFMGWRWAMKT